MKGFILLPALTVIIWFVSCTKDSVNTAADATLTTSDDSLAFDTVFTNAGSITHYFKVFNRNNGKLKLSRIALGGGAASFFSFNADGFQGPEVTGIEINANDSIYVFVTVNIDPTQEDLPFIIEDSLQIVFNGNERWVKLSAWGQNAHYLHSRVVLSDTTWHHEKPIVITGGLLVAEGVTLSVDKGTRIFVHADAPLIIDGTLKASGEANDSMRIVFQGDRLDKYYRDLPGGWPGIYFRETSHSNVLKHVLIKNAYQGLVAEKPSPVAQAKVTLEATEIRNCYDAGIIASNSSIHATNVLVSNCGKNIVLVHGGDYRFVHCTDVAVSNNYIPHKEPVLILSDFVKNNNAVQTAPMQAYFVNCIFWGMNGTVDDEVVTSREGNETFDVVFSHCLWKVITHPADLNASAMIENEEPLFSRIETTANQYDFRVLDGSPAINAGLNVGITTDIDGKERVNIPDIGAYETTF